MSPSWVARLVHDSAQQLVSAWLVRRGSRLDLEVLEADGLLPQQLAFEWHTACLGSPAAGTCLAEEQSMSANQQLPIEDVDRVIEMAWEDRTPFEAIEMQFGLKEKDVIALMRFELKASSFRMWRRRVSGRRTKHQATSKADRFRAPCHR